MITRVESVVLAVADLPAATRAYSLLFGHEPLPLEVAGEIRRARFTLANSALDLISPEKSPDSWLSHWLEKRGDGPLGIVFGCDDVGEEAAVLAQRALRVLDDIAPLGAAIEPRDTRGVPIFLADSAPTSDPQSRPGDQVYGLDHAVVRTTEGDAARSLYEQGLGLRVALDRSFEQWNARLIFCRVGGVTVEIAAALPEQEEKVVDAAGSDISSLDRLWGFTWQVRDADKTRARLIAGGLDVSDVRDGRKPGTRVFTVRSGTCETPTLIIEPARKSAD